jgi:hypothetical protein
MSERSAKRQKTSEAPARGSDRGYVAFFHWMDHCPRCVGPYCLK